MVKINWTVWDKSERVEWIAKDQTITLTFRAIPLSVIPLKLTTLVAVCGRFDEFGSENLLLFDFEGNLVKKILAPELGSRAHFGSVSELNSFELRAQIGFFEYEVFREQQCMLNLKTGRFSNFLRCGC